MELRAYWRIFLRRWWIAAGITVATAILSFLASPFTQGNYTATMRVLLSVPAEQRTGNYYTYDKYYSMLSTEFLTDDFIEVVQSHSFLEDVRRELGWPSTTALSIRSQPRAERAPRILTVIVSADHDLAVQQAADATAKVLATQAGEYFTQLGPRSLVARVIDPPVVVVPTAAGRNYLNVGLRTALGLLVGLGIVYLLHYLDTKLYDLEEVERHLGLPVLSEIPPYPDIISVAHATAREAQVESGVPREEQPGAV